MSELLLDQQKVAAMLQVSDIWMRDVQLSTHPTYITGGLAARIEGFVLTDHLLTEHVVVFADHPASWWQHTKAVHFPTLSRWLRRPPRHTREHRRVTIESNAAFPQARIAYPDDLGPVRIWQQATDEAWSDNPGPQAIDPFG